MRKAIIFIVIALLSLCAAPVYASEIPALPHAFYGDVYINGSLAPIGATISASGEGVYTNTPALHNPVETTKRGSYGIDSPKLLVQGDILDGATITFYVNGRVATTDPATVEWHSRETTRVDLSVTIAAPPPVGDDYEVGAIYLETNLFGIKKKYLISEEGEIPKIEATSEDGMLTFTIAKGTTALDKDDNPLSTLTVAVDPSPPDPPEGAYIIGLPYDFRPEGATFDPPITFEYTYDPDDIPEGVDEEDLVLAYYDEEAGEWVELDCVVDTDNNIITFSVSHFTTFAILGTLPAEEEAPAAFTASSLNISPAEVNAGESVSISVKITNSGDLSGSYGVSLKINDAVVETKSITLAGGSSQTVSFTTTQGVAGTYTVNVNALSGTFTVKEAPANWVLIIGTIVGVVVVILLCFFLVVIRRRAA